MLECYNLNARPCEKDRSWITKRSAARQKQPPEGAGKSQAQAGRELGVSRGAVSRAVKEAGSKVARPSAPHHIEHLTGYRLEEETRFRVRQG